MPLQDDEAFGPAQADRPAVSAETLRHADSLRRSMARLTRQLRTLRAGHGVSPSKLSVLGRLYRAATAMTAVDLARQERLQPQSLTRIIADLEERGLIERRKDHADRRQLLIEITEQGRALLVLDARQQSAWLASAIEARLTGTEQALLAMAAGLIDRLAEQADQAG